MNIAGLHLEEPIMNAAGTLSKESVHEVKDLYGAVVTKTVTLEPRAGNPPPRVAEVPGGLINAIGLQSVGIEKFLEEELYEWCSAGLPVIVSIFGAPGEVGTMCKILSKEPRVSAVELNLSCPNTDPISEVHLAIGLCRHYFPYKELIVKLGYENVLQRAEVAARWKVDALTLINSIPALTWLPERSEPFKGGLSGPVIKPIALRAVYEVSMVVDVPLIASGGAGSAKDVEEFIQVGASAVQIGSMSFVRSAQDIIGEFGEVGSNVSD